MNSCYKRWTRSSASPTVAFPIEPSPSFFILLSSFSILLQKKLDAQQRVPDRRFSYRVIPNTYPLLPITYPYYLSPILPYLRAKQRRSIAPPRAGRKVRAAKGTAPCEKRGLCARNRTMTDSVAEI